MTPAGRRHPLAPLAPARVAHMAVAGDQRLQARDTAGAGRAVRAAGETLTEVSSFQPATAACFVGKDQDQRSWVGATLAHPADDAEVVQVTPTRMPVVDQRCHCATHTVCRRGDLVLAQTRVVARVNKDLARPDSAGGQSLNTSVRVSPA